MSVFLDVVVSVLTSPTILLLIFLGAVIGMTAGALPGLGGTIALALLIPVTFSMEPVGAFVFLAAAKGGVNFSGAITAILFNIPGSAVNTATLLDGHPMAKNGEASKAIGASAMSSAAGAIVGIGILVLMIPLLKELTLLFGPPEFFILAILGLLTISVAIRGAVLSGLVGGAFGLMISYHGWNPITGAQRFTFGTRYLFDGVPLIPVIIGVFAISEAIKMASRSHVAEGTDVEVGESFLGSSLSGVLAVFKHKFIFLQSSIIGFVVGAVPAIGGVVSSFMAYMQARNISSEPERFGTGYIGGVIATESANDAKDAGDLIPTLTLGIPGSASTAVLLGAFIIHGIQPGPRFLATNLDLAYYIFVALVIANVLTSVIGLLFAGPLARLTTIPTSYIIAIVTVLSVLGSYAIRNNAYDILTAVLFGVVGYLFITANISRIAFIIAIILGPIVETSYHQSMQSSGGDLLIFVESPVSQIMIALTVAFILLPFLKSRIRYALA